MMHKAMKAFGMVLGVVFLMNVGAAFAGERGTAKEAEALVKKAVAHIKAVGREKAFADFGNQKGHFVDRDLYVFVYDLNGKCVAHGQNAKMVGNDLIDMKDPDGRYFVKDRVEIAKMKGKGWQDYKFTDPLTKRVVQKSAYVERYEDLIVGSGIYK